MNICVVSPDFPTKKTIDFVFVEQLCKALSLRGEDVTVITPQSLTKCLVRKIPVAPRQSFVEVPGGMIFSVHRPKYLTVGNVRGLLVNHNKNSFDHAVDKALRLLKKKPDVIYGHFWQSVRAAYTYAKENAIPLFVASGEEHISQERIEFSDDEVMAISNFISGAINVSTNNQNECIEAGLHTAKNSVVIPNGIDNKLFMQLPKSECRKQLGLCADDFIVTFVGQMKQRKGPLRLDEALKRLNDDKVKALFIGKGDQTPTYSRILMHGEVGHSELPLYLSASDVFVLPTLHEGCCNAIIEAMACGLPVISSDLAFNYDVLDNTNSILIDPNNIDEIAKAITKLKNNEQLKEQLVAGALTKAKELTLDHRADKIMEFIKKQIQK